MAEKATLPIAEILAGLGVAGKVAPALLAAIPSKAERQARTAYQGLLGYKPGKEFEKEMPGLRQRILSATEQAKAQLGRGGLEGGRRHTALGKLYQSTFGALAKGEGELRNRLMQKHLESYKAAAGGLAGLGAAAASRKAAAAKAVAGADYSDIAASYGKMKEKQRANVPTD